MRTSYQPNINDKKDEDGEIAVGGGSYISMLLISAYYDMYNAVKPNAGDSNENQKSSMSFGDSNQQGVQEGNTQSKSTLNKSTMDDEVDYEEDGTSSSIKKALMVAIPITFLLIVAIAGMFIWKVVSDSAEETTIEALQSRIDKMYSSSNKEALKDSIVAESLDSYYDILSKIQSSDKKGKKAGDISKIDSELNTIGYYIEDKRKLDTFNSDEYDLTKGSLLEDVQSIRDNVSSYSVPGLALTINNLCSKIESDYSNFINLRQELDGITDYANFNSKKYNSKIEDVAHTPNRKELQGMLKNLNSAKKKALAKAKAEEEAKKKAEEKAKKALEEAEAQRRKAQEALRKQEEKAEEEARQKEEEIRKLEERQKELEEQQRRLEQQQQEDDEDDEDEDDTPTPTPDESDDNDNDRGRSISDD